MSELTINFKKKHLWYLNQWLNIPVIKSQNRFRNEFLGMIWPSIEALEAQRLDILTNHAKKDEKGKMETDQFGNAMFATAMDRKGADDDFNKVLEEDVTVDVIKPKALAFVKDYLKKFEKHDERGNPVGFGFVEGQIYDQVCDILGVD